MNSQPPADSSPFVASLRPLTSEAGIANSTSTESKLGKGVDEGVAGNGTPFMVPLWPFTSDKPNGITNASTSDSTSLVDGIPSQEQQLGQPFMVSLWPFTSETTRAVTDSSTTDTAVDVPPSQEQNQDNTPFVMSLWPFVSNTDGAAVSTNTNGTGDKVVAEQPDNSTPFAVSLWPFTSEAVLATEPTNAPTQDAKTIDTGSTIISNNDAPNLFEIQSSLTIMSQGVEFISSAIATNARSIVDISADATEFATMYVIENTPKLIETSADQMILISDQFADTMYVVFDED